MLLLNLPLDQIQLLILVLVRVSAILFSMPFLESRNVPVLLKAGFAMAISLLVLPQVDPLPDLMLGHPWRLATGLAMEIATGMLIGLAAHLLITGIQLAGQIAGFQMGFAIANVVDPASSMQIPILSQFLNLFALMIFMTLNMHQYLIKALVDSFERLPFFTMQLDGNVYQMIMTLTTQAFIVAVQIGAPVMVALLLTSVALGLVARTVPQMQIFIVAMPLKIILGLFFLGFSLPFCANYLHGAFISLGRSIQGLMRLL
jgi:flagellar biosynthetic protein FliR